VISQRDRQKGTKKFDINEKFLQKSKKTDQPVKNFPYFGANWAGISDAYFTPIKSKVTPEDVETDSYATSLAKWSRGLRGEDPGKHGRINCQLMTTEIPTWEQIHSQNPGLGSVGSFLETPKKDIVSLLAKIIRI
jgi:hypothetical protein